MSKRVKRKYYRANFNKLQIQLERKHHCCSNKIPCDPKKNFAYSARDGYVHDKACVRLRNIPVAELEYFEHIPETMYLCPACEYAAIIREGVRFGERVDVYLNFFGKAGATLDDLRLLIVEHGAYLKWKDFNTLQLKVHDDYWMIVCKGSELRLMHNNYYVVDGQRIFGSGFHTQAVPGNKRFADICKVITEYNCEKHNEQESVKNWVRLSDHKVMCIGTSSTADFLLSQFMDDLKLEYAISVAATKLKLLVFYSKNINDVIETMPEVDSLVKHDDSYLRACFEMQDLFNQAANASC